MLWHIPAGGELLSLFPNNPSILSRFLSVFSAIQSPNVFVRITPRVTGTCRGLPLIQEAGCLSVVTPPGCSWHVMGSCLELPHELLTYLVPSSFAALCLAQTL